MKTILFSIAFVAINFITVAQTGTYIKYEMKVKAIDPEMAMMAMMFEDSEMEIALNEERTFVRNRMGTVSTTEVEVVNNSQMMTMYLTGMMGEMAFSGNVDDLKSDQEKPEPQVELTKETKTILGYKCKKAIIKTEDGNVAEFWYTEKLRRPIGIQQMPEQVPGLCLSMKQTSAEMEITYTAVVVEEKKDLANYKVVIPEGVEVQSFESMEGMGGGY